MAGELISRREAFKRLAGLAVVAAGYEDVSDTAHYSPEKTVTGNSGHAAYHAARKFFPVVMGSVNVSEVVQHVDCPIYMFHRPSLNTVFSVVMENLNSGRQPITVSHLSRILLGEVDIPEKPPFCLSFDDGYLMQYQIIFPFLKNWSIPATFNVMGTGWQGDGVHSYMNGDQIREINNQGSEIASHTVNHANLLSLRESNRGAYLAEIFDSKRQLEELLQKEVTTFAYPIGAYDTQVIHDVSAAGYKAALSTQDFRVQTVAWLFSLGRSRR